MSFDEVDISEVEDDFEHAEAPNLWPQKAEDGRWLHRLSPSSLNMARNCPEMLRIKMREGIKSMTDSRNSMGTAVHWAAEEGVKALLAGQGVPSAPDLGYAAAMHWRKIREDLLAAGQSFEMVFPWHDNGGAEYCVDDAVRRWHRAVLPRLAPVAAEKKFEITLVDDEHRVIKMPGVVDLIDENFGVVDYKTSAKRYSQASKQRDDMQMPSYLLAALMEGWIERGDPTLDLRGTFLVFVLKHPVDPFAKKRRGKWDDEDVQEVPIYRNERHFEWLVHQAKSIAKNLEDEQDHWVMNDTSWLCKPQFCSAWDKCKGAYVRPEDLLLPREPESTSTEESEGQ